MADPGVHIDDLPADRLEELEPLWNALREHHAAAAPEYGAPRSRAASWAIRSTQYASWLASDAGFALVARADDGQAVGYAFVRIHGPEAIWPTEASGELETLSVLPEARGAGTGATLIDAAWLRLAARDITDMAIVVLDANADALRFYAREGFETVTRTLWGEAPAS